ncbi:MAG TPA: single-stranded-DNA-specific exonuclease RecJ [Chthoniobacterales bacterium]|nr:single-stranded-DNA-specific exonuclease RecJ [Chthoniobacterales bacterium]
MQSCVDVEPASLDSRRGFTGQYRWILRQAEQLSGDPIDWNDICSAECIARLLARKGFTCNEEVENFLRPRLKSLSDPFLLPQMEAAVCRILSAIEHRQRIVLFGDYDVDGVTSLAILSDLLRAFGNAPELFLPLRMEEGYGLSRESVDRCLDSYRPQLLIAIDCGTSSVSEIAHLTNAGVDVIVLDHHEPKTALPGCVAVVNPKIDPNCKFDYLCSAGVVFKVCHGLLKRRPLANYDLRSVLDLVALATVADIVPLTGENRVFVQRGSMELAQTKRLGLRKLLQAAAVRAPIGTEDIGFRIGPRLNAAGRLSTAEKALQLLLTRDDDEALLLAGFLDQQNRERQEVEKQTLLAAEEQIQREYDWPRDAAIVVSGRGWHPGVVGIVASRIARKYHRPTIVIGIDQNGAGKGSGRSILGLHLVRALERCAIHLEKFGGHEMAAGLSIHERNLPAFVEAFRAIVRELLSDDQLEPQLHLDHELALTELNLELLRWHEMLQPFGNANPQPLFFAREVTPVTPPRVMGDKHLRLHLQQGDARRRAIFFDGATQQLPTPPWDIAFRIRPDDYDGQRLVEIQIQALRTASLKS